MIAYPTEAVWGLGCDPFNAQAVEALLQLKSRPIEKGLILIAAQWEQLNPYIDKDVLESVAKTPLSDKPTTWLLPFKPKTLPTWVVGQHTTVAVRVSQHLTVKALSLAFDGPIISTSANPAGCQAARDIFQLKRYFGSILPICRGRVGGEYRPSQIIDFTSGQQLR